MTTKSEYERAKELGRQARRNGKKRAANPYRSSTTLRDLAGAWEEGFNEAMPVRSP